MVFAFSLLLLVVAIALINNTIRLTLFSRRFTIKSMQLVGATRGFIRRPFLLRSLTARDLCVFDRLYPALGTLCLALCPRSRAGRLAGFQTLGLLFGGVVVLGMIISGVSTFSP